MAKSSFQAKEVSLSPKISHDAQAARESELRKEGVVQSGIAFPSASVQTQLLIVRLNLASANLDSNTVTQGLKRLCRLFAALDNGDKRIEVLNDKTGLPERVHLREVFNFSATLGFGEGFFDLLQIPPGLRPSKLKTMPDHKGLGDVTPYSLGQTDMILQLGSSNSFVNRWVLENSLQPEEPEASSDKGDGPNEIPPDIVTAVEGWATLSDIHAGFQRTDGRNLQGFNDGVSNPRAGSPQFDAVVWSIDETNPALNRGTYMVFQKVLHDLDQWRELDVDEQQEWVGRSKRTGLLLGTLDEEEDDELADGMQAGDAKALAKWKKLFNLQSFPQIPFFSPEMFDKLPDELAQLIKSAGFEVAEVKEMAARITDHCPAWSHVRKVNPRGGEGTELRLMFRRGYPFMESGMDNKLRSGLLFVSFQNDIVNKFEFIKSKWAGNKNFPTPEPRREFTAAEKDARHQMGRFSASELEAIAKDKDKRALLGLADDDTFQDKLKEARTNPLTQQTGREGLAGPSELGTVPTGEFLAIMPLGGGYYFVPPIPKGSITEIGQQFFVAVAPTTGKPK